MTKTNQHAKCILAILFLVFLAFGKMPVYAGAAKINVLLIDGQNNHDWAETSPVIKEILEKTGRFKVDVCTSPKAPPSRPEINEDDENDPSEVKAWENEVAKVKQDNEVLWRKWRPAFSDYDVVVGNYNGQSWPDDVKKNFEKYMRQGGGFVVVHAADNSFPRWPEYNEMIGVGGWGERNEKSGPMLRYRNGKWIQDTSPGEGGTHGNMVSTLVITHEPDHPIMKGLPKQWMHVTDEIYGKLRGPAKNLTVLASSFSDKKDEGTGEQEPGLMVIDYHKGRVFHTIYGHSAKEMQGLGFQITLQRGTEWAATGKVTLPLPKQKLSETEAITAN